MPHVHATHRPPQVRLEGVVVPGRDPRTPDEPEYRDRRMAPPIVVTLEEMARQLTEDPEFLEWVAAERRGELFAGRPR